MGVGGSAEEGSAEGALAVAAGALVPAEAASGVPAVAAGGVGGSAEEGSAEGALAVAAGALVPAEAASGVPAVAAGWKSRAIAANCSATESTLRCGFAKVVGAMVAPSSVGVLAEEENSSVEGAIAGAFEDSGERVRGLRKTRRSNTAVQLCRSLADRGAGLKAETEREICIEAKLRKTYRCNRYIVAVTPHGSQHGSMTFNTACPLRRRR